MERERERFTALGKGRERYGHDDGEVDSPVKIQAWFRASMRRCSSNTNDLLRPGSIFEHGLWCHGASSLGMRSEVKMRRGWEREVRRGKFLRKKISEKWSVSSFSFNGHNYAECRWDNALVEGAHWGSLFTKLPLSHGWSDLKTSEICFHFWASSLSFLSDRITKTGWPKPSDGVQKKCFSWAPPILDDEWWILDHITQNTLHPNNL